MKKVFKLIIPGKNKDRTIESIKNEVRKYLKRERNKTLPEGVDYWDFDCKFGNNSETSQSIYISEITKYIDDSGHNNWEEFYLEILAKPGYRKESDAPQLESK
jgi:Family of unknown function (DUF6172)